MLSRHILMNILSMNFHNYFVTKNSLNNILYRKFSLNFKQHSKTRKESLNEMSFNKILYTARIYLNLITSKAFRSSRLHMFYKKDVLEDFAKFTGKHLCWNLFLIKLHTCIAMIFVNFSRTSIF